MITNHSLNNINYKIKSESKHGFLSFRGSSIVYDSLRSRFFFINSSPTVKWICRLDNIGVFVEVGNYVVIGRKNDKKRTS